MHHSHYLFKGKFGLEREAVRVDAQAMLSKKKHPQIFTESNPYITKDFAEAQIEMVTPPCDSIGQAVHFIEDIQTVVLREIGDDLLWGQSNPPHLPEGEIPVAEFKALPEKVAYRHYLTKKYGKEKSIISGVHFNYSIDDAVLQSLYQEEDQTISFTEFKNNLYLKLAKYLLKDRWFLIYLTNASPVFHQSYYDHCVKNSTQLETGDCLIEGMNSLRNSQCGYRNIEDFQINYDSLEAYNHSVDAAVATEKITGPSELYTPVRLKKDEAGNISYLELRFLDIFPFSNSGLSQLDLEYIHLYMVYALSQVDFIFSPVMQKKASQMHDFVTNSHEHSVMEYQEEMLQLHRQITAFFTEKTTPYDTKKIFASVEERILDEEKTYAFRLREAYMQSSYLEFHLDQARQVKRAALEHPFRFLSYPTLELSTKILLQEAIIKGLAIEVLDAQSNFIRLTDPISGKKAIIQQATKTNLDQYANILAMENKLVTKELLIEQGIRVPEGQVLHDGEERFAIPYERYETSGVVIKPNATNFGVGITIYPDGATKAQIDQAIDFAFTKDTTVLIEPFLKGKEYRFLVIGDEVVGVLYRQAASVVGDGVQTIEELVIEKNKHPYRGKGYKTPLEKIELGAIEREFLALQGLTVASIPEPNERIFLRENSNISTGGDSIDMTDEIHESYKQVALKAMKALGVKITGVDMMIEDIEEPATERNHGIIELNFNPAIHIHTYPLVGQNRLPAKKILAMLFKKGRK